MVVAGSIPTVRHVLFDPATLSSSYRVTVFLYQNATSQWQDIAMHQHDA